MTTYTFLLFLHNCTRWLVLFSLLYALYRAYTGWFKSLPFTNTDNTARHVTATIAHVQLILGLVLYFISPLVDYFLKNFKEAVHDREIRFFGMEHSLMMLVAIIVLTIGSVLAKRKPTDLQKFKTMAIWYTITLIIILANVPWPFSPLVNRPWMRWW